MIPKRRGPKQTEIDGQHFSLAEAGASYPETSSSYPLEYAEASSNPLYNVLRLAQESSCFQTEGHFEASGQKTDPSQDPKTWVNDDIITCEFGPII